MIRRTVRCDPPLTGDTDHRRLRLAVKYVRKMTDFRCRCAKNQLSAGVSGIEHEICEEQFGDGLMPTRDTASAGRIKG